MVIYKVKVFENNGDSEKTASELIEWYSDESASVAILNSKNYIEDYKPIFKEYGIQVFSWAVVKPVLVMIILLFTLMAVILSSTKLQAIYNPVFLTLH